MSQISSEIGSKVNPLDDKVSATSWRDVLPPHPAAELLPRMNDADLHKLGEDIKANGQQTPVVIFTDARGKQSLLDGISRLDGMVRVNLKVINGGAINPEVVKFQVITGVDPVAYALTANVHRRHLSTKNKRELAGNLLRMFPDKSDRQIAEWISISHNTVKSVREELIRSGQIDQTSSRLDKKGRRRPATRSPKTVSATPAPKSEEAMVAPAKVEKAPADSTVADTTAARAVNQLEPAELLALIPPTLRHALERQILAPIVTLARGGEALLVHPTPNNVDSVRKKLAQIEQLADSRATKTTAASSTKLNGALFSRALGLEA